MHSTGFCVRARKPLLWRWASPFRPRFANGVWLAQFSTLADLGLVPATIAAAVRLELGGQPSVQSLAQALAGRSLLLVLDTCEHRIMS